MSFVRYGQDGSEVYVYESQAGFQVNGGLPHVNLTFATAAETADYLEERVMAGWNVPLWAIDNLRNYNPEDDE